MQEKGSSEWGALFLCYVCRHGGVAGRVRDISACQLADTGHTDMSVEDLLDDWPPLDLAEEAVAAIAPDGPIAGYADVINRSFVTVSVYGYVHPDVRGMGQPRPRCEPRPQVSAIGRVGISSNIKQMFDDGASMR